MKLIRFVLFCFLIILGFSKSHATTYYVAKTGSDLNTGTSAKPFKTIPKGYSKLIAGDTLVVRAGIYTEQSTLQLNRSGTSNAPIKIKSEVKGAAIIDLQNRLKTNVVSLTGSYNILEGFKLRRGGYNGVVVHGNHNKIIRNEIYNNGNTVSGSNGYGIGGSGAVPAAKGTVWDGNYIHHNGRQYCQGITTSGCSLDHGLYTSGDNETIINNVIAFNPRAGIQIAGRATISNMKIYNNVLANNGIGIILYKALAGVDIKNNIVVNNSKYGYYFAYATGSGVVFKNNVVYGNATKLSLGDSNIRYSESGTVAIDPLFVNKTSDYRLQSTSKAIGKGLNLYTYVKTDRMGTARPPSGAFDIGAYER